MNSNFRPRSRPQTVLTLLLPLLLLGAGPAQLDRSRAAPPAACDDPMTLRLLASGLYFRGAPPEGFRPTELGLRNPETGEEIRVRIGSGSGDATTVRIRESRIDLRSIRTTGETPDGWRCEAEFTVEEDDRTVRGEATYTSEIDGLEYLVGGRFSIDGVEFSF